MSYITKINIPLLNLLQLKYQTVTIVIITRSIITRIKRTVHVVIVKQKSPTIRINKTSHLPNPYLISRIPSTAPNKTLAVSF